MGRFVSGDNVFDSGNTTSIVSFSDVINKPTTLAGYGITDGAVANNISFSSIVNRPTTLAGYGITDGGSSITTLPFSSITGKPTTLAGFGITDGALANNIPFSSITGKPTTLAGYGITDGGSTITSLPFSSITNKPTTLAGYGITDGVTTAQMTTQITTQLSEATVAGGAISNNFVKKSGGDALTGNYSITGALTVSGNITSAGDVTAYSDERLKKDWTPLAQDFFKNLSELKYGTYTRIDTEARQVGVSAQELKQILPEAVIGEGEEYLSVAYGNAALVAVISLSKYVIQLEERLALLEKK